MTEQYQALHAEAVRTFRRLRPRLHRLSFQTPGGPVDMRVRIVEGATRLVFNFHGAIDPARRTIPVFPGEVPNLPEANQICIADPTLTALDQPVRIAWYSGHATFDAQGILAAIMNAAVRALKPDRTIYFGNSGGGFAALYYSWLHRGSFAVVGNPQTNIAAYYPTLLDAYLKACWPDLPDKSKLSEHICSDLPTLYGNGFPNTVVYLQSMGDRVHSQQHMLPMTAAVANTASARAFILQSEFQGALGHVANPKDCANWITAICRAPGRSPVDILTTLHQIREAAHQPAGLFATRSRGHPALPSKGMPKPPSNATGGQTGSTNPSPFTSEDLAVAARLRAWRDRHIRKAQG